MFIRIFLKKQKFARQNWQEKEKQLEKVLVIVGPTAVGKTALSIALAKNLMVKLLADSMQVYRSLDIGTAKVTETEKKEFSLFN